jgi:hypothetical protein
MADLAGRTRGASIDAAIPDDRAADPCSDRNDEHAVELATGTCSDLRKRRGVDVIVDDDRQIGDRPKSRRKVDPSPIDEGIRR